MAGALSLQMREALDRAVGIFGSQKKLADAVGLKQPSINRAVKKGQASSELAIMIERATNGAVPKHELRPDLFGDDPQRPTSAQSGERELSAGMLSRDTVFRLIVRGPVGPVEIERLIEKLQLDKSILSGGTEEGMP
jgi:DNA-binding transcriptional regulator YdaS (Cro superfamily)